MQDLAAARAFWVDVMGFAPRLEQPALAILVHPGSGATLALVTHDGADDGFDERRVGLDHLALDVADLEALRAWETTLDASNVSRSPIVESPVGWHLNLRAPDNLAVELLVMKPEATAMLSS